MSEVGGGLGLAEQRPETALHDAAGTVYAHPRMLAHVLPTAPGCQHLIPHFFQEFSIIFRISRFSRKRGGIKTAHLYTVACKNIEIDRAVNVRYPFSLQPFLCSPQQGLGAVEQVAAALHPGRMVVRRLLR